LTCAVENNTHCFNKEFVGGCIFLINLINESAYLMKSFYHLTLVVIYCFCVFAGKAQNRQDSLKALFDTISGRNNFSGCVLVAENGIPLFERAHGYANCEKGVPLNINTRFELASVSKQFTAMAIMQLKEKGELAYEDTLSEYFPELPYKGVTIRHLLTHTSGIPDFIGLGSRDNKVLNTSRINFNKDIIAKLPLIFDSTLFAPGSGWDYSNTNYLLLAQIVEKVSGMSFADYMRQHVFIPAGMNNTCVYSRHSSSVPMNNYALSYVWDPAKNAFVEPDSIASYRYAYYLDGIAGPYGISSNVEDMLRWDQALYSEKLIRQSTLSEAFIPYKIKDKEALLNNYGFGWMMSKGDSLTGPYQFHSGGYSGYQTLIVRYPERRRTVVLLTNSKNIQRVDVIINAIENILTGRPMEMPDKIEMKNSISLSVKQLQPLDGIYVNKEHATLKMKITCRNNCLFAKLNEQIEIQIYPESSDSFFYVEVEAKIKFVKNADGKVTKLILYQNGAEISMDRGAD
jgi:CubicO group peptidase (beta-lactamase class C family)